MAIKQGSKVILDYEGKLETGEVFDTSQHGDHSHPLTFIVGEKMVIPGFEKAVLGMKKDQEKEFAIPAKEAYGEYKEELKQSIPKNQLPPEQTPKEGMMLIMATPDGKQMPIRIAKVGKDKVTLDLNHPLAGKKLIFKIKILEIEDTK